MQRQIVGVVTMCVALVALLAAPSAAMDERCGSISLRGSYVYSADGFFTENPGVGPFIPIAEAGTFTFDGSGGFSTVNTISFGGQIFPRTARGTYTVGRDCTGSASIIDGATFNFGITRATKSIRLVVTTEGVAVTGTMEKQ